jgi:hypothetical protein
MVALPNRASPIGPGVNLDAIPAWFKVERQYAEKEFGEREAFSSEACLKATFKGEGLGELCAGPGGKQGKNHEVSWERIRIANLALWLARPSALHVELVVTTEPEPGPGGTAISGRFLESIRPHERYASASLTLNNVEKADRFATAIQGLPRPSSVWTATRFLWLALTEELWETRYVNLWVAIEALFGPENRDGIGRKIRTRVAKFLNADDSEALIARDIVKSGYDLRSAAVHGSRLSRRPEAEMSELMLMSEGIMLTTLRKIVSDPDLVTKFCAPSRDAYLDGLARRFPP